MISVPSDPLPVKGSALSPPFQKGLGQGREWRRRALRGNEATVNDVFIDSDMGNVVSDSLCDNACVGSDSIGFNVHASMFQPHVSVDSVSRCFRPDEGVLSRPDKDGHLLMVKHPLSLEGFHTSLWNCPDAKLVQFVLDSIENGVRLGPLEGSVDSNPA